jgi:hypothetical protein
MYDYLILWLTHRWAACQNFAHIHHMAFKRTHHATHLAYFSMVASHGPYHIAALALLVMGIAFWLVKLEE